MHTDHGPSNLPLSELFRRHTDKGTCCALADYADQVADLEKDRQKARDELRRLYRGKMKEVVDAYSDSETLRVRRLVDPGPSDAADLFECGSHVLNHGGRAYRRHLVACLLTGSAHRSPMDALREANAVIAALTGSTPEAC